MCDHVLKNVRLQNVAAVGLTDTEFFAGVTSLQFVNPFSSWGVNPDPMQCGFGPSSVKMSKNAQVTAVSSRQRVDLEFETSGVRRGLQIYSRKACSLSCGSAFADWALQQSFIFDDKGRQLQIDQLAVSDDGFSIVALNAQPYQTYDANLGQLSNTDFTARIYVFERELPCSERHTWKQQQTLEFPMGTKNTTPDKIALNDKHTIMLVRKLSFLAPAGYQYSVLVRERAASKAKSASSDGYKFGDEQPLLLPSPSYTFFGIAALSHDGLTIVCVAVESSLYHLLQYTYNCETKQFELVSNFVPSNDGVPNTDSILIDDVKFGGACSERLFILYSLKDVPYECVVEVHSRQKNSANACNLKNHLRVECCATKLFEYFSKATVISVIRDAGLLCSDTNYTSHLLTEAVDGDLFIVVNTFANSSCTFQATGPTVVARLWRQKACKAIEWQSCNLTDALELSLTRLHDIHCFDMLSFDAACSRYYFPLTQRILAIEGLLVNNPDGCFYFAFPESSLSSNVYYIRVHGDTDYVEATVDAQFGEMNGTPYVGTQIVLNARNCAAKDLDVIVVGRPMNGPPPSPMDLIIDPSLIVGSLTIPMRLCFSVVSFSKTQ